MKRFEFKPRGIKCCQLVYVTVSLQDNELIIGDAGIGDYVTALGLSDWYVPIAFGRLAIDIEKALEEYTVDDMEYTEIWYAGAAALNKVLLDFQLDWRNYKSVDIYNSVAAVANKAAFAERNNDFKMPELREQKE